MSWVILYIEDLPDGSLKFITDYDGTNMFNNLSPAHTAGAKLSHHMRTIAELKQDWHQDSEPPQINAAPGTA